MGDKHRTDYTEDCLRVKNGTQPEEIQDFVIRRALNPVEVAGVTVRNFNNHEVDELALREQADDLIHDHYLIPYQASGVWGYMVSILPKELRELEILTYKQSKGEYYPYPNYFRHSDTERNDAIRKQLKRELGDGGT